MTYVMQIIKKNLSSVFLLAVINSFATDITVTSSGSWSNLATWGGNGFPQLSDKVIVANGVTLTVDIPYAINELTVAQGGTLTWSNNSLLSVNDRVTVNGTVTMNGGNISLLVSGSPFELGAVSSFTWEPGNNTSAGATLFTNGTENFSMTSTLIIKNWYNFLTPLGSVVSGNFGHLTLNSLNSSNLITEWNQNNQFQSHQVKGTLTVDQGWITLDKSGAISNTSIGSVVLSSVNSSFYGHNGNHNGSFSINIGTITNTGGNFYGISDGNGNITLNVSGNFTNAGNVKIINNTGVTAVSNGDANFNVSGMYSQTSGDTRIIYNVSTTNSGSFNSSIGTLQLTGGIFMAQTGCHTRGDEAKLTIQNNFNANFINATDKFRVTSLTSIGPTLNNLRVRFEVKGNLTISGQATSEFTSSASSGSETFSVTGNLQVNSGTVNLNYGTSAASHQSTFVVSGTTTIAGGNVYYSRNSGVATINLNSQLNITGGNIYLKGDAGTADFYVTNYNQTGGNFIFHNNTSTITNDVITLTVTNSFSQTGGILNFDNNINGGAQHILKINSSSFTVGGTGLITRGGAGTSSVFGLISFNKGGTINYTRTSVTHTIQQTKQVIQNATTLDVISGNIIVSGGTTASTDYFTIASGATLSLRNSQLLSGATTLNSGIMVDSGGTLKTYRTFGLYDGTGNGAISATGTMNFYLDPNSVIEYNGMTSQVVTGIGSGTATTTDQKYGILRINFTASNNLQYAYANGSNVFIRTSLELDQGEFNLNGNTVTIESGETSAITRKYGYIKSEIKSSSNTAILKWQNLGSGAHTFPFGHSSTEYVPVTFTPLSGMGGDVSIATRSTDADNYPLPLSVIQAMFSPIHSITGTASASDSTSVIIDGINVSQQKVMDRWWDIQADGFTANINLSYRGAENTLDPSQANSTMGLMTWQSNDWNIKPITGTGVTTGVGTVAISNTNAFGAWGIISYVSALPIELVSFKAQFVSDHVELKWTTTSETNNDHFSIERSRDGKDFAEFERIKGAGNSNSTKNYSAIDKNPFLGTSYYRLKQVDFDGKFTYSEIRTVNNKPSNAGAPVTIDNVYPSPFDNRFTIRYSASEDSETSIMITNASGQVVHQEKVQSNKGLNKYDYIDEAGLPKGFYIINLINNNQKVTQKILKN